MEKPFLCLLYPRGRDAIIHVGAVTHTTVNGISHGKFAHCTSHSGFRIIFQTYVIC